MVKEQIHPWKCPKCKAPAGRHGTGTCKSRSIDPCQGLICECDDEGSKKHGVVASDPCPNAVCYHCEWSGTMPHTPKEAMKGWPTWAKTAIKNGWIPPKNWSPSE